MSQSFTILFDLSFWHWYSLICGKKLLLCHFSRVVIDILMIVFKCMHTLYLILTNRIFIESVNHWIKENVQTDRWQFREIVNENLRKKTKVKTLVKQNESLDYWVDMCAKIHETIFNDFIVLPPKRRDHYYGE